MAYSLSLKKKKEYPKTPPLCHEKVDQKKRQTLIMLFQVGLRSDPKIRQTLSFSKLCAKKKWTEKKRQPLICTFKLRLLTHVGLCWNPKAVVDSATLPVVKQDMAGKVVRPCTSKLKVCWACHNSEKNRKHHHPARLKDSPWNNLF
jgi:hypothetical protein